MAKGRAGTGELKIRDAERSGQLLGGDHGFAGYCVVAGTVAVASGAGASLLGGSWAVRLALWLVVLVGVAAAAGWWWARVPVTARRWTVGLLVRPAARTAPTRRPS
ncbi:hypothetical protein AB0O07_16720 [Streptomyces sp. NPDC093085]|uniref:hypothetical protein n=1 Tax=Streptomyces sp. NPDC093085 TaxID=3155068 RepID=UPI003426C333